MTWPTLPELQWIGSLVAIGTGAAALVKLAPPVVRVVGRWTWQPVFAHFRGVHRMIEAFPRIEAEVTQTRARVEAELGPNGGGSLKDQVTMIGARQSAIFDGQSRAAFQADRQGRFTSVNRAFEQLVGYPSRDLLGMRWVNLLHQEDAETFMVVWQHAINDGRILRRNCRIVTARQETLDVCVDAVPIIIRDQAVEWQGYFVDAEPVP